MRRAVLLRSVAINARWRRRIAVISRQTQFERCCATVNQQPASSAEVCAPAPDNPLVLSGRCNCGTCGWDALGASNLNIICHCSVCRSALKAALNIAKDGVAASAFQVHQIQFVGRDHWLEQTQPTSKTLRFYCKTCGDYVAADASLTLGGWMLPHALVSSEIDDLHRPNHRVFYDSRPAGAEEPLDSLPRWIQMPKGSLSMSDTAACKKRAHFVPGQQLSRGGSRTQYDPVSGRAFKDILPVSPTRAIGPREYLFTESDPPANFETFASTEKLAERLRRKYEPSPHAFVAPESRERDVIIIGGGHNGLVSASYLAKGGLDVCVLERRHLIGGAAVTEEIVPGFKFSRASYLAGLLRETVVNELGLEKYGFKYLPRDPSSFTPTIVHGPHAGPDAGKHLMLGKSAAANRKSISQFSSRDADAFDEYEEFLCRVREMITPLIDDPPPDSSAFLHGSSERKNVLRQLRELVKVGYRNRSSMVSAYELFTGPASKILDRWFESDILKTTLATDAVVGAMYSPRDNGSAYVLLHHVMGSAAGQQGTWAYVEGGMGAVSNALGRVAIEAGAEIVTNATVERILWDRHGKDGSPRAYGVQMADGSVLRAKAILSNATPYHTFLELLPGLSRDSGNSAEDSPLPQQFVRNVRHQDYACGSLKINCAVSELPNFDCFPNQQGNRMPGPQHRGTIHFENRMEELEIAHREASAGIPATRPVIEMTIPSSLDKTLAPDGKYVVTLFVQYAPYDVDLKYGSWADPGFKEAFADRVFSIIDEFAPNFSSSVLARDILSPLDLERVFGLHKGSITHGSLAIHQLFHARPVPGYSRHRSPLHGLYLCGAGAHPGGGVMGAPGRNCARIVLSDFETAFFHQQFSKSSK